MCLYNNSQNNDMAHNTKNLNELIHSYMSLKIVNVVHLCEYFVLENQLCCESSKHWLLDCV